MIQIIKDETELRKGNLILFDGFVVPPNFIAAQPQMLADGFEGKINKKWNNCAFLNAKEQYIVDLFGCGLEKNGVKIRQLEEEAFNKFPKWEMTYKNEVAEVSFIHQVQNNYEDWTGEDIFASIDHETNVKTNKIKTMETTKFNKGEWCFYDFELCQVTEVEENRITEVQDGIATHSGSDLSETCYPLEMSVKRISDSVAYWSDKFHELKNNALNHPDLHRELIEMWVELCENRDNEARLRKLYDKLNDFGRSVLQRVHELSLEEVGGVYLFRR